MNLKYQFVKARGAPSVLVRPFVVAVVVACVMLCDFSVEALLLFGREQGAYALAPLLADGIVARAALGAERAVLVARLVEDGLDLAGLLVRQAEVAAHPLEDVLLLASRPSALAPAAVGPQAVGAVGGHAGQAAEDEDAQHHEPDFQSRPAARRHLASSRFSSLMMVASTSSLEMERASVKTTCSTPAPFLPRSASSLKPCCVCVDVSAVRNIAKARTATSAIAGTARQTTPSTASQPSPSSRRAVSAAIRARTRA